MTNSALNITTCILTLQMTFSIFTTYVHESSTHTYIYNMYDIKYVNITYYPPHKRTFILDWYAEQITTPCC